MANIKKYLEEDFELYKNGKITLAELSVKYNTQQDTVRKALNRAGLFSKKKRVKIMTPYKSMVVDSIAECASELRVCQNTVYKALKGNKVKLFEELGITLEEVE